MSVARALKLRLMSDELVMKFLMEWRSCNREERTSCGIKG